MNRQKIVYRLGDMVRIKAGPFTAFTGKVEGINQAKSLLKVKVDIFGRATPVKVNFSEAEKLEFQRPLPPFSAQD
jgi:transcription termination/antitermination protein NusG